MVDVTTVKLTRLLVGHLRVQNFGTSKMTPCHRANILFRTLRNALRALEAILQQLDFLRKRNLNFGEIK